MSIEISVVASPDQMAEALAVRVQVFVLEQGVPAEEENDQYHAEALHLQARENGVTIGTARLVRLNDQQGKIGRVAVLNQARGRGVGRDLMLRLHQEARSLGVSELVLGSQVYAVSFYERLGYRAEGDDFLDGGIPHRRMVLCLS